MFKKTIMAIIICLAILGSGTKFYYAFIWEQPTEEEINDEMYAIWEECPSQRSKGSYKAPKYDGDSLECKEAYKWFDETHLK